MSSGVKNRKFFCLFIAAAIALAGGVFTRLHARYDGREGTYHAYEPYSRSYGGNTYKSPYDDIDYSRPDTRNENNKKRPAKSAGELKKKKEAAPVKPQKNSYADRTAKNNFIFHTVKKGETLYSIARKYKRDIESIRAVNSLSSAKIINAGMKLKIPQSDSAASSEQNTAESRNQKQPAAKAKTADKSPGGRPAFIWPVKNIRHCARDSENGVKPIGIIIRSAPGSGVNSAASGEIKRIGEMRGYGKYVVVKHNDKYITVYSMLGIVSVKEGDRIGRGALIGKVNKKDARIHFQIDKSGRPENPFDYLPSRS